MLHYVEKVWSQYVDHGNCQIVSSSDSECSSAIYWAGAAGTGVWREVDDAVVTWPRRLADSARSDTYWGVAGYTLILHVFQYVRFVVIWLLQVRLTAFQSLGEFISTFADTSQTGLYLSDSGSIVYSPAHRSASVTLLTLSSFVTY